MSVRTRQRLLALIAISPIVRRFGLLGMTGLIVAGVGFWQGVVWLGVAGIILAVPLIWAYLVLLCVYFPLMLVDALRRSRRGGSPRGEPGRRR